MNNFRNKYYNYKTLFRGIIIAGLTVLWWYSQNPFVLFLVFFLGVQLLFPCNACSTIKQCAIPRYKVRQAEYFDTKK